MGGFGAGLATAVLVATIVAMGIVVGPIIGASRRLGFRSWATGYLAFAGAAGLTAGLVRWLLS
jgi:hypothetical protein